MITSPKPNRQETMFGTVFFLLWLFILPSLVSILNAALPTPLTPGMLNFLFYLISFLGIVLIFRKFLWRSVCEFIRKPLGAAGCAVLGFAVNYAATQALSALFSTLVPDYANFNDHAVRSALLDTPVLMTVGVVLMVPVTEETLFRGLVFRGLYDRSPVAAYALSIAAFSAIHVMGYIGSVSPTVLLLSFVQYLPAGLCLCLACRCGGVLSPIILHAAINAAAVISVR